MLLLISYERRIGCYRWNGKERKGGGKGPSEMQLLIEGEGSKDGDKDEHERVEN